MIASLKARRTLIAVVLIVALAIAAWAILSTRDDKSGATAAARDEMSGMEGMAGMEGMDMSSSGSVRLDPDEIRTFGITFDFVEERTLESEVRTVGIVNFDETRVAAVSPRFGGYIERLYVDFTGKPVRVGQPLVEIYSPELVAAQEELLLAARLQETLGQTNVPGVPNNAPDLVRAARQRFALWDISDAQIEQILKSGTARRTLTLHAPVSGIVVEKNILAGQAVQAGEKLYTIADLSEIWIEAELREADAGVVEEGSAASAELAAFPGRPIAGRVEYVYPTLQTEARTLMARIAVRNPDLRLKPGMFATVRIFSPVRRALTVPTSAIVDTGERRVVFVDMGNGEIMPHEVEIGRTAGDYVEVLAGLEPGQRVVTSAQFLIDSESNLGEVMKAMMGQMSTSDIGRRGR
jgi:multidrug efflux pump subunit AcrA (membrane-fusion protein)